MIDLNVPIWQLTGQQFLELTGLNKPSEVVYTPQSKTEYVYGIAGLAGIANCSLPTAQKLKNSGTIPYAQSGRKIIFEVSAVLEALKKGKGATGINSKKERLEHA
jgi:hypothetical protein